MSDRFTVAEGTKIVTEPRAVAKREAENALRQFDAAMDQLEDWLADTNVKLRPSLISGLQRLAVEGVDEAPGTYRPAGVQISGSNHSTPSASEVPALVEELCEYVNDNWDRKTAIHLAAFILWRVNWIHPFRDGNGRTARIVSYLVLNAHSGFRLPGTRTIPDQISDNKTPYYEALEESDASIRNENRLKLTKMEKLLEECLATQLLSAYESATGKNIQRKELDSNQSNDDNYDKSPKSGNQKRGIIGWLERHPVSVTLILGLTGLAITLIGYS